jgi:NitT/TauT family transport system substrate-binding protein
MKEAKMPRLMNSIMILFLQASLLACAARTPEVKLTPITVQLQWTHQAEFAGLYAADQQGYYAAEGLQVQFLQGGVDIDPLAAVRDGKAQFGTAVGDQLLVARSAGYPFRAIATIFRISPTVFFCLASSGITRPQDFVGKKIRAPVNLAPTLHAMTTRVGVLPNQYTEVNLPSDVQMFASGEVPVWGGYINGMVISVQQAGYKINRISPDDYGIHFYGDVLFADEVYLKANPDLTLRFLRASLKGWAYAVENPEKIGAIVARIDPKADVNLENLRMASSLPLVNTGEDHIGWMRAEVWIGMEKTLREQNVLQAPLDVTQAYTMEFLQEIYK